MAFEEAFDLDIPDEDAEKIATVKDAVSLHRRQEPRSSFPSTEPPILSRRVVVTGVGLLSSVGPDTEETWRAVLDGRSGIGPITQFDATAFQLPDRGRSQEFRSGALHREKRNQEDGALHPVRHRGVGIRSRAIAVSRSRRDRRERVGVYIGSGIGGFEVIEREHQNLLEKGPRRISPFFIPATIINLASGYVSIRTGAKGPNSATATACTTSAHAIGDSFQDHPARRRRRHDLRRHRSLHHAMGIGGFAAMRALSQRNDEPERASRPWDKDRDGFVVGEGAGILILEELEFAKQRGAPILAEIVGYGMSARCVSHHLAVRRRRRRLPRHAQRACATPGLEPEQIRLHQRARHLDRSGRQARDRSPSSAPSATTPYKVAVSSTKSMTGHLLGGAGGLEAGITVLAIRDQIAPPTINHENPDPECDLDYVPNKARPMHIEYALSNSFGFGGTNGSLIFRQFAG